MTERIDGRGNRGPRTITITETATLRMAESMTKNYSDAKTAILDLIDNCVDNRSQENNAQNPLLVTVRVNKDEIAIINKGGEGLDEKGLTNFFNWGHSEKPGQDKVGQYGVGGKAAMGFLGSSISIRCSAKGSNEEFYFNDPNWDTKPEAVSQQHQVQVTSTNRSEGYFQVNIKNLKRRINPKDLMTVLGEVYMPLLERQAIKIRVNHQEVEPLKIPFDERFAQERIIYETGYGDQIPMTIGILPEGTKIEPGVWCYYFGRLMERGLFFGHPTPARMPQASRLFALAHLDHDQVTTNKSGFTKGGTHWEETSSVVHQALRPWYAKLETIKNEKTNQVERYETALAQEAKRVLEHLLSPYKDRLFTIPGQAGGRLAPTQPGTGSRPGKSGGTHGPSEGETYPDRRAVVGKDSIRRAGIWYGWELVAMGTPIIRCAVEKDEAEKEALKINTEFPLYQASKQAGAEALKIYLLETAIIEVGKRENEGKGVTECIAWINEKMRELGELLNQETQGSGPMGSKGSIRFNKGR